jgi:acetyltransferase
MGTELYRRLVAVAREEKMERVICTILTENYDMIAICRKLGFHLQSELVDGTVQAELKL